ncbi:putative ribonuclease H-like domain-containing protein [Tanacetum coccineum]
MNVSPIPTTRIDKDHPKDQIIRDFNSAIQTRIMTKISDEHAMKVIQALEDPSWIEATQDELLQFQLQKVWTLVNLPNGKRAIRTKWVFRNKKDERGIVIRNKEGLMDVKSAFLYGTIEEEVYVCQPLGFEDPQFPNKVYKVEKALYGLHQSSRAWYETLSTYLIENGFRRGTIYKTLFIKKDKGDILLVQMYVDDIIFGSIKKSLCDEFEGLMHKRFQISSIGELIFFLGLQVQQKKDGIFISQDKYVAKILKKFDFATVKTASTLMVPNKALVMDEEADSVDVHLYRSMIGSLMYLTASRPDIMFAVCACARFQVTPKMSHLHAVKRIFRYLKELALTGNPQLEVLWIRNQMLDYGFNFMNTMIYIDNESIIFIVKNPVFHSKTKHIEIRYHFIRDSYEKRFNFLVASIGLELKDKKELAIPGQTTTGKEFSNPLMAGSLPKTISAKTRSERVLEKPNEPPLPEGHTFGRRKGSMEHTFELMDIVPPTPHDSPLTGGYTPRSDEGRLKLKELMAMCTKLSKQVLDLEKEKDAQAVEILKLKQRVNKLERKRKSSISHPRRRIYRQVESSDNDLDKEDASKQERTSDKMKPMFKDSDFDDLDDSVDKVMAFVQEKDAENQGVSTTSEGVSTAAPRTPPTTITAKGVAIKDVEDSSRPIRSITTLQPLPNIDPKDKGKGLLVEEEPEKPEKVKRRDQGLAQIESDAELAQRLHEEELAELDRAQKEKQKQEEATNAALAEEFDEIQARMDADHELAVRLTHEEQEKYTIEERATLLAEYFERRKKQLAAERAEAIRNKPPTRAQVRNRMITYLKHMESNEEAATDYEQEKEELRTWLAVVPDEDETVDPEILSVKYPIVDWESQNLGSVDMEDIHVYKIIRADGNTSYHKIFSSMLRKFDRQDLMDLHRLVMKRFEYNTPEGYNLLLWGVLKKLYENYGVHSLLMDGTLTCFNMLVEKRYHLIKEMLKKMLNWKLEAEAESTMAFELLKFIKSQSHIKEMKKVFGYILQCFKLMLVFAEEES